ncbi:batten's disease protein Cln3 [Hysterangium stoloniferum]|nr:batten's disease protein Cln3 [Hysterangium stoloniferum]
MPPTTSTPPSYSGHEDEPADFGRSDMSEDDALLPPGETYNNNKPEKLLLKLGTSFFLFGLINNVLYVVILSAALDLVPPSTPKGIIAFCNIAPALVAKVGWPYILKGKIRYRKRLAGCCALSVLGMLVVSAFDILGMRLLGISVASFASGLGELTFLQLSTRYHPLSVAGQAIGYFASGTGAAGLVGAALWWFLRSLGVRLGIGLSAILPFVIPLTYLLLLPSTDKFLYCQIKDEDEAVDSTTPGIASYAPIPTGEEDDGHGFAPPIFSRQTSSPSKVALTFREKMILVRPLLVKYMLPIGELFGIAPTLVFPVPSPDTQPFLSFIIKSIRDYYPLWQLVYQTTVFLSRSSLSVGIPPLPVGLLPLPAILQTFILITLAFESALGIFDFASEEWSILCVFLLISLEGICGGLAYVNTFYHVGQEKASDACNFDPERARQEREFKIGSIGFSDSLGILLASIVAVPTEVGLCAAQVRRGKMFCNDL